MTFPEQPAARAEEPGPDPDSQPSAQPGGIPGQSGPQAQQYAQPGPDAGAGFGPPPPQPEFAQAPQQPGFGAPGQGFGYPPPQYSQYPQQPPQSPYGNSYGNPYGYYGHQPPTSGTNGMAIAAMVCGLCGFLCLVPGLVGIILGIVSLPQIKRSRQSGRGMAITGIAVGSFWILAFILLLVLGHHGQQVGNSGSTGSGSGNGTAV
jgi:hypothetical protein